MMSNSGSAPFDYFFKYYRDLGCKGIGEMCSNLPLLDPLMQNMFKGAEASGLPLTFHMSPFVGYNYGVVDDAGLPGLEACLQRFPKLRFFGHSQTFWAEIGPIRSREERFGYPKGPIEEEGAIVRLMRKYPNLYGDLSAGSGFNAVSRDRKFGIQFMTEFQDRLMFGTDICQPTMPTLRPLANYLKELRASGEISEAVFQKIARENAIRLLKL
jgi:predicted TIM-barrel fold metal-dependent hydrolase